MMHGGGLCSEDSSSDPHAASHVHEDHASTPHLHPRTKSEGTEKGGFTAGPDWEKVQRVLSFRDYNTRVVFSGLTLLGIVSGMTGTFLLLRKRSLLSDSISHATLPGLAMSFILFELISGKGDSLFWLLVGGTLTGFLAMAVVIYLPAVSRIKNDAALALSLTFFYGCGVVLLSVIQQMPTANASGLEYLIYGNAATLTMSDVSLIQIVSMISLCLCLLLFKEFSLLCFDSGYSKTQGYPVMLLDILLMSLIVVVSVVGLQAVGLLLMMSLLITPAVAARFWAKRLIVVILVAGLIGGLSSFVGVLLSSLYARLPTGAIIVITSTGFFVCSLFFGTYRGLVLKWSCRVKAHQRLNMQQLLRTIFDVLESDHERTLFLFNCPAHLDVADAVDGERVFARRSWSRSRFDRLTRKAVKDGWLVPSKNGSLKFTNKGFLKAREHARQHRFWELYLIQYADVAPSHVHQDVERIEEVASPDVVQEIETLFDTEVEGREMPQEPHPLVKG